MGSEIASTVAAIRPDALRGIHLSNPRISPSLNLRQMMSDALEYAWKDGLIRAVEKLVASSAHDAVDRPDTIGRCHELAATS